MLDEQRADLLVDALANRRRGTDSIDDPELMALIDLGAELERLGASIAAIEEADAALTGNFTRELRAALMAEHPRAIQTSTTAPERAPHLVVTRSRSAWRRLTLIAIIAVAIVSASLAALIHGNQPAFVGTAAVTSTASRPHILAFASTVHGHPAPTAVGGGARLQTMAPRAHASPEPAHAKSPVANQAAVAPTIRAAASDSLSTADTYGVPAGATLVLPAKLPALPARAPVYTLRYRALSNRDLEALARAFFGLHAGLREGITTIQNGDSLTVTARTGEITYNAAARPVAARRTIDIATAKNRALQWIRAHDLASPALLTAGMTQTVRGDNLTVRFAPKLPYVIDDGGTPLELAVTFDTAGRVMHAHRLWPQFVRGADAVLIGLGAASTGMHAAAVPSAGATSNHSQLARTRVLRAISARLVYVPIPVAAAGGGRLAPYYRLVTREQGARATTTVLLPATAARP